MPGRRPAPALAALVGLLFLVGLISYIDRGSLSIAAPVLIKEAGLSAVQMGVLLSAFFWSYAALQIPAGWVVDRYPVAWVLGLGVALWALATLLTGFAAALNTFILLRLLLGAGEAVLFPCLSKVMAQTFPAERRGLPNSIIDAGTKLGPALGVFCGALLVAHFGWRVLFIVLGGASLVWLLPWIAWSRFYAPKSASRPDAGPAGEDANRQAGPRMIDIFRSRDFWGVTVGSSIYSYAFYFFLTWLPTYLVRERHLSLQAMAVLGAAPFLASACASMIGGWLSDALIQRGVSQTLVRKSAVGGGLLLSMAGLPAALVSDVGASVWLLSITYVAFGIFGSNFWAISQTLAGPGAAGKWIGAQNAISAIAGIVAPLLTGVVVEATGSFVMAFTITAALATIGAAAYAFMVGPIAPLDWPRRIGLRLAAPECEPAN